MRKLISLLLTVALIFALAVPAMAATVKQEANTAAIKAGEEVTVTVTLDEDVADIVMYQYSLYYNKSLFTMTGSTGSAVVSNPLSDADGDYFMISFVDTTSEGVTVSAGTLAALTFRAKQDLTEEQAASFLLRQDYFWDTSYEDIEGISLENGTVSVTVSPEVPEVNQYTVTLTEGAGYTIAAANGSTNPVEAGGNFSFTVTVLDGYVGDPVVKINNSTLGQTNGVYTISNVNKDYTVTVSGIRAADAAADRVIFKKTGSDSNWPNPAFAVFLDSLTIKGLAITGYEWDSAMEVCTVTLYKTTAQNASFTLAAQIGYSQNPQMMSAYSLTIDGTKHPVPNNGSISVTKALANGEAEVVVMGTCQNVSATKTIHLVVDGASQPEPEPATYEVSLAEGTGYTIAAAEGSTSPVEEGGSFSFTVAVAEGYEGTPVVKANETVLSAVNGVYTIENITENQTVTVEGITEKMDTYDVTLTAGTGYTIAAAEGSASPVVKGGSFSFTVTANNGYEGPTSVKVNGVELTAENGVYTIANIAENQVVTVEGVTVKANMYTVTASADVTATKGDNAVITVQVTGNSNEEITGYNDYDVTVSYDPAALTYVSAAAAHTGAEITHDAQSGTIRIVGHGEAKNWSDMLATLTFTAKKSGSHDVTIRAAKIDNSGNAITLDAPEAAVSDAAAAVKVAYPVTLPGNFTGGLSVLPGGDYRFTAPSEYYDIMVTVGGEKVTPDVDGLVYTIRGVNGDVVIAVTGKTYNVIKNAENAAITGADTAQYGTDYAFTAAADSGYSVTGISVKIGGEDAQYSINNGTYIISGSNITGDVFITVTTQQQAANTTQITFEGVDASEVVGGLVQYATNGQDFPFELNEEEGYVYTAKLGEEELKSANGVYTIPGAQINGTALTVTISKEVYSFHPEVTVSQYIQLNGTVMWLVTATEGENVLAYGEEGTMFWSEKYNAYCWLVISSESEEAVRTAALAAIAAAPEDTAATTVGYDYDVNQSGAVDVNDAQLTYDMYQAQKYSGFNVVSMDRFLEADVNGDGVVNVEDARAVVAEILK